MTDEPTTHDAADTTPDRTTSRGGLSRRNLVAAGAASWFTVSLAGCSDDNGGGEGDGDLTVTTKTTTTVPTDDTTTADDGNDSDETTATTATTAPTTTTTTDSSSGGGGTTTCTTNDMFVPGGPIGFLIGIFDSGSGDPLGNSDLDTVTVNFKDDGLDPLELTWDGGHTRNVVDRWGGKLTETADLAPGTYRYDITVETDGETRPIQTGSFSILRPTR